MKQIFFAIGTKRKSLLLLYFLYSFSFLIHSQNPISLEECIQFALKNNLNLKNLNLQKEQSAVNLYANKSQQLPNLSGSVSVGYNLGRTIDPTSNTFATQSLTSNSVSLSSNMILFQGGQIRNSISQAKKLMSAANLDFDQGSNDVALSIAQAYLQVLFAEENITNATRSLDGFKKQLDQTDKLIAAGSRPKNDRLEVLSQIATGDQTLISFKNSLETSYINLKLAMGMDMDAQLQIVKPDLALPTDEADMALASVYNVAVQNQPSVLAGNFREESSLLGIQIAKGQRWPTLSIGASLQSNYASLGKELDKINIVRGSETPVFINGDPASISFYQQEVTYKNTPYLKQLDQNLGLGIFLSLNVPIIDNGRIKSNIDRARLNYELTKVQNDLNKQNLKTTIQRAITDLSTAKKQYVASEAGENAAKAFYEDLNKRFKIGTTNNFELSNAKIRYENATLNKLIAKYDLIFKAKILDFYLGKKITL
ncbi:MAG: TolC family protein [Saprospiraceae bacterium]|nr:TolC family protein [Saprospiraceae bacterium]